MEKRTIPVAFRLVKLDFKPYCDPKWIAENKVETCGVFYLYDANRHVHICSLTPSYELWAVAPYMTFSPDVDSDTFDPDGEKASEIEQTMMEVEYVDYFDVSSIDKLPGRAVEGPEREEDEDGETYYKRAIEELREQYAGNPPWF